MDGFFFYWDAERLLINKYLKLSEKRGVFRSSYIYKGY